MTDEQVLVTVFVLWLTGGILAPMFDEFEHDFSEYIWWPLMLMKTALKGLCSVLFTGWRV